MPSLDRPEKRLLLDMARSALVSAVEDTEAAAVPVGDVPCTEWGGAFVTLQRRGQLRGCIGEINSRAALATVIARCARAAALEDPRFRPVRPDELAEIDIEISVLSPPRESRAQDIEPGKHGVIVSRGHRRAVLLPKVAVERGWGAERLLDEACVKAGLGCQAWKTSRVVIETFTAEAFGEADLQTDERRNSSDHLKPGYSIST